MSLLPFRTKLGLRVLPFLALALSARATTVIAPDFDHLVSRAQVIFDGNVTGVRSQWIGEGSEHRIVTFVTFKVNDLIKGDAASNYTIRMLGGTVDGRTMRVTDAPEFAVGDHDLLFVENNGSQFVPLVGIGHGRFHIGKDQSGSDMLVTGENQPLTDVNQLGADEHAVAQNRRALSLTEFKSAVRTRMSEQKVRANTP
ncbi:MAG: hypothetical protein H0X40_00720 [Chthoniobacterales bacterium]|nr:hypothetical protein [Chthoniobacterales bacterium]